MNYITEQELTQYLENKGIKIIKNENSELVVHCVFNGCDRDSKGSEAHLYFSKETGQYDCKKCGSKGNLITLKKHFGDFQVDKKLNKLVEKLHSNLPDRIRKYLNGRGISDETINKFKIGFSSPNTNYPIGFYTIPCLDESGNCLLVKHRQDPDTEGRKMFTSPKGSTAQLFGQIKSNEDLFLVEGEIDCMTLIDKGYNAVTNTQGAGTWNKDWNKKLKVAKRIYVCYDTDEPGQLGATKVLNSLFESGCRNLYQVKLPDLNDGKKTDINDYVAKYGLDIQELQTKYSLQFPSLISTEGLAEMTTQDIVDGLEPTIKYDNTNKVITFLAMLTAYTEDSQMNLLFNAQSSSGKSYIALETSKLFPSEDILRYDSCSRKAFFHESGGEYDKETNTRILDISKKIMIFTDQPRPDLMAELRPLLSHDNKMHISKISDKNQQGGNETKTVCIKGYPVFVYCTANGQYDEQEATRFIVLSPDIDQEKLSAGIALSIRSASVNSEFRDEVLRSVPRQKLIERIKLIKYSNIEDVIIRNHKYIEERFKRENPEFSPRHQRDTRKIIGFIKAFALLNFHNRERSGNTIFATDADIQNAFQLWSSISVAQDMGISPYYANIYNNVILPLYIQKLSESQEYFEGVTRAEICKKYYEVMKLTLSEIKLRQDILPTLEAVTYISQPKSRFDSRVSLVLPMKNLDSVIYSEDEWRVNGAKESYDKNRLDINSVGNEFIGVMRTVEAEYDSVNK